MIQHFLFSKKKSAALSIFITDGENALSQICVIAGLCSLKCSSESLQAFFLSFSIEIMKFQGSVYCHWWPIWECHDPIASKYHGKYRSM